MATFRAILIRKTDEGQSVGLADFDENDLMDGDVTVRVEWSSVNYKDGLAILAKLGYQVIAATGRPAEADYLRRLGAAEVIDRAELTAPVKPLAKERWAGGIDSVGSTPLANVLSMTRYGGAVAACGLA